MYQCSKKLVKYKEYSCFDHSDFPAHSMFTFGVCWGNLGTNIFGNLSLAANNTRFRLPSRLSFRFLWLCCKQHLRLISSKAPLLGFTWSKLEFVIPQLSQNRPNHRCFSTFSKYFFKKYVSRTSLGLVFFLSRNQPTSLEMLQNKLFTVLRWNQEPCHIKERSLSDSI